MNKLCNYLAAACLLVCGCIFAFESQARVCFAADGNCGSGGNFAAVDEDAIIKKCTDKGYILAKDCRVQVGMQVAEYCPYDHRYVMCCGLEYAYTKCIYPLKPDGYCGGKYKCACDTVKYPFAQKTATVFTNTVSNADYDNSIASGGSCSYTGYDQTTKTSTVNLRFTKCACDRGLYPKTAEECSKNTAGTSQDSCTDSEGNQYFANCICTDEFKKYAEECTYGIDVNGPKCTQGDTIKVKECCACNRTTYPYSDQTAEGVKSFESCAHKNGCSRGDVYRATECNLGYKLGSGSNTGKCVPKTCGEILQDYLISKNITNYVVYATGKTIPSNITNVIVGDNVSTNLSTFQNKKVVSGQAYAKNIYGNDELTLLIKKQCSSAPVISSGYVTTTGKLDFTSVAVKTTSSWNNNGGLTCTNCSLDIYKFNNNSVTSLNYDSSMPNSDNMFVKLTDAEIKDKFVSNGYDYEVGSSFKVSNTYATGGSGSMDGVDEPDPNKSQFRFKFVVSINGQSNRKVKFKASRLHVIGGMKFKYADVRVSNTYIGLYTTNTKASGRDNPNYYNRSNITIYNTDWYLYEAPSVSYVYMTAGSFLGVPQSGAKWSSSTGSRIIMANGNNYQALALRIGRKNSEDDDDCWNRVFYISSFDSITTYLAAHDGRNNPICTGIGHQDTEYNAVLQWHGNWMNDRYWEHISGTIRKNKHGCWICTQD